MSLDISEGDGVRRLTAVEADNSCIGKSSRTGVKKKNSYREDLKEFFYGLSTKECNPRSLPRNL
jgi:hypothetical protein